MKLYDELADWYTLLTPLAGYEEEASFYLKILTTAMGEGRHRLLELGAGAGHNAHYLAGAFDLCLVDVSPRMLALAAKSCPSAALVQGDMRDVRLGQTFDVVFVHDAVCYMRTVDDLRALFATASVHLRPGGALLIAPDFVAETFKPGADTGGSDGDDRALRYLEWSWQRPGEPDRYVVDYTLVTRLGTDMPVIYHDRHEEGLFPRAVWGRLLAEAGFTAESIPWTHSEVDYPLDLFLARR